MATNKKSTPRGHMVAQNRRARRDYNIIETIEAGLELVGTEVKSLREGRGSIAEAYAAEKHGELWLFGANIPMYEGASVALNHEPLRQRKILLKKREIDHLLGAVNRKGMTLVPLSIYFNKRGYAKMALALGEGRQKFDKREAVKQRDWNRQKSRLLRDKG